MLKIKIPLETLAALHKLYEASELVKSALLNPQMPLQKVKKYMGDQWNANFDREGGMYGAWPDLAKFTQDDRENQGFPPERPILKRTEAMRQVFGAQVNAGYVGHNFLQWNFEQNPAGWILTHQFGMPNPWPNAVPIPARPIFMNANEEFVLPGHETVIEDTFDAWIELIILRYYT